MKSIPFGYKKWSGEISQYLTADLLAGLTLWAMIVPEAVAYASLSSAPSAAAGLYGIIIVLPIYALFASSRFIVATSTSAISVTMAGFMAVMTSEPQAAFSALVIAAAIGYLVFYFFRLGFIADFISEPVSRGFMFGLALFIIVGQAPKLFGVEKAEGNTFEQLWGLIGNLPNMNVATFIMAIAIFAILIFVPKINPKIPAGLVAIVLAVLFCSIVDVESRFGVELLDALPEGLPKLTLPAIQFADLAVVIPAAIGLVILGASESMVLAESMAEQHNQEMDADQQFFAFGAANLVGGFFGALLGAGSTSSTLVNHEAGAKTLMSTVWASVATIITVLFLTGLFAYLPEVFLGVLIIHAVYHMLRVRQILAVYKFSRGEFILAIITLLSVLLFDVLNGLIVSMMLNMAYILYRTARVRVEQYGYAQDEPHTLLPLSMGDDAKPLKKGVLAIGLVDGQVFYASARLASRQAQELFKAHPEAKTIVLSLARTNYYDYSSLEVLRSFVKFVIETDRKLYLTDVHNPIFLKQLQEEKFDPEYVDISTHLDVRKL